MKCWHNLSVMSPFLLPFVSPLFSLGNRIVNRDTIARNLVASAPLKWKNTTNLNIICKLNKYQWCHIYTHTHDNCMSVFCVATAKLIVFLTMTQCNSHHFLFFLKICNLRTDFFTVHVSVNCNTLFFSIRKEFVKIYTFLENDLKHNQEYLRHLTFYTN